MKRTSTVRTPGFVLRGACAAVVAGCCLLTPALSLAAPASAAADSHAAEASAVLKDAQAIYLGGLEVSVPADWTGVQIGESMIIAAPEDGLMTASLVTLPGADAPAADDASFETYFSKVAQQAADNMGAKLMGASPVELADGTGAYAFVIDATKAEDASMVYALYVPTQDGGITSLIITADPSLADGEEVADAIAQSAVLSKEQPSTLATASVKLADSVTAGGITLSLPAGMTADDDESSPSWMNDDGFVVCVIPDAADGAGTYTSEDIELFAQVVAAMFGGETLGSTTVESDSVTFDLYAFSTSSDGAVVMGAIAFVPAADGTLTAVLSMVPGTSAADYGDVMSAVFESIELA